MPGETGVTVVTTLVCSFCFACEAAGAIRAPGIPCAVPSLRASIIPLSSGKTCREAAIPWAPSRFLGRFRAILRALRDRDQKCKCLDQESPCPASQVQTNRDSWTHPPGRRDRIQQRLTLPFSYRHRRSLLPQFQREVVASLAEMACSARTRRCGHKGTQ